jgi:predicted HTH transcriptional regulator
LSDFSLTVTIEQIDLWRSLRSENQNLEFKEAKNQFDNKKLFKYCVAIANEGGGYLVLGVSDILPRQVVGTNAFNNSVEMASKIFSAIGFRVNIQEISHPDGRIVVFQIPSRPRGTAYHYDGSYLMRSGEELVPMSEDRLRAIFAEGQPDWLEQPALMSLSPQEIIQYLDTQAFFDLLKLPYPSEQSGVLDRLLSEKLISKIKNEYCILNIGAVLLAKNLRDFEGVWRKAPRVIVYLEDSKLNTKSDLKIEKGYASGFKELIHYIMSQLPQNEVIKDALRQEVKLVSEIVVRELVANALIHQDLQEIGMSPTIEIYSNRLEISNPGEPKVPVERFIDGYQSRNERLADLMRRFGICEEKSSGIDRVVQTSEMMQLPAPEFLVEFKKTVVIIYGHRSFKNMDRNDRIRACYQHCVLQWVMRSQMTNQSLRERFGLAERSGNSISQIITNALEQKLIKRDPNAPDSRKFARYLPYWA